MEFVDLYADLGVQPDASDAQLRSARRAKARQLHSDLHGGSDEAMAKVNRAYKILSDPEHRAHYDKTGLLEMGRSRQDKAMAILIAVIRECVKKPGNIVTLAREMLHEGIRQGNELIYKAECQVNMNRARLNKVTGPQDESNLITDVLADFVTKGEHDLAEALKELDVLRAALELLDGYHSTEMPPPPKKEKSLDEVLERMFGR